MPKIHDPYGPGDPEDLAPADDITRWIQHLAVAHRDLRVLVYLWDESEDLWVAPNAEVARKSLLRVLCVELFGMRELFDRVHGALNRRASHLPEQYVSRLRAATTELRPLWDSARDVLKGVRNNIAAHRDDGLSPWEIRQHIESIDEDDLRHLINAFSKAIVVMVNAPVARAYGPTHDGKWRFAAPMRFADDDDVAT